MRASYEDLHALTSDPPSWYDENGVPRYAEFAPKLVANIYADEAALLEIECQACGAKFMVALSWDMRDLEREFEYGDPPNLGCCSAGPTMNSVPLRVHEFWRRESYGEWKRISEKEKEVECEWAR